MQFKHHFQCMIPLSWHCNLLSDVVWNLQHFCLFVILLLPGLLTLLSGNFFHLHFYYMVAEIFVSRVGFFFPSHCIWKWNTRYWNSFHTSIPWNLFDQFWGFCLFGFDLMAPFRVGCNRGKTGTCLHLPVTEEWWHLLPVPPQLSTSKGFLVF